MKQLILSVALLTSLQSLAGNFDNAPVYKFYTAEETAKIDLQAELSKCRTDIADQLQTLKNLKMTILQVKDCSSSTTGSGSMSLSSVYGSITFLK